MFWMKSPKLHLYDQMYGKNSNIVKYDLILKEPFSGKWEVSGGGLISLGLSQWDVALRSYVSVSVRYWGYLMHKFSFFRITAVSINICSMIKYESEFEWSEWSLSFGCVLIDVLLSSVYSHNASVSVQVMKR